MLRPLSFYRKKTLFPAQLSVDMDLAVVVQKLALKCLLTAQQGERNTIYTVLKAHAIRFYSAASLQNCWCRITHQCEHTNLYEKIPKQP